jgi:hypothetical protein
MASKSRTREELQAASEHLLYEVEMFDATAKELLPGTLPLYQRRITLESFVIHARALGQFFGFGGGRDDDDVLASHFFADERKWRAVRPRQPPALKSVNERVGEEIAHLSYNRLGKTAEDWKWKVHDIHSAMMRVVAEFLGADPQHLVSSKWNAYRVPPVVVPGSTWGTGTAPTPLGDALSLPNVNHPHTKVDVSTPSIGPLVTRPGAKVEPK